MSYRVRLPAGGARDDLDIVEPNTTAVQRFIRREGLGKYEPSTAAGVLAACESAGDGFVMFDIGANMGLYGALAASMFRPSAVHLFEPAPESARAARAIQRRNRLPMTVVEAAVGDEVGVGELQISPVSDASNSMVEGFRATEETVTVETVTVDAHVERTGVAPSIVKIDVETFEPAVLRGAADTIEQVRPVIVIEVLRRRGVDHGEELTDLMRPYGYHFYELSADPSFEEQETMRGSGTTDRDWLMAPEPLPGEFAERWARWHDAWRACTVDQNPRTPVVASTRAAWRRGGAREVAATARRYLESRRRTMPET